MNWKAVLPKFVVQQWDHWFKKMEAALVSFTPAYITKNRSLFAPLIALVAVVMAIVLLGIAVGSFFSLFASLLVLYFILTKVFGIRLDMGDVFEV